MITLFSYIVLPRRFFTIKFFNNKWLILCCQECKSGKLFEWVDGPLIDAMKTGGVFLADEISLADDSVLERLNSLLGLSFYLLYKIVVEELTFLQ